MYFCCCYPVCMPVSCSLATPGYVAVCQTNRQHRCMLFCTSCFSTNASAHDRYMHALVMQQWQAHNSHVSIQMQLVLPPGRWTTTDALLLPATPGSPPLHPHLVARYPARKAIKDKDWPKYIERALRAVADNEQLKKYDVLSPLLRDQYDVIGWLQVRSHFKGSHVKP